MKNILALKFRIFQTENMKLISLNCNGIRSAFKKGLPEFILKESPDIISFQEVKALEKEIDLDFFNNEKYHFFVFPAEKKGYSGTAVFTKKKPKSFQYGTGHEIFDREGRVIQLSFSKFEFFNIYFPSGTSGEERQALKMKFLSHIRDVLNSAKAEKKSVIVCGDVNIAHTEKDIHDPKGNAKNSGFLPEERQWLTEFLSDGWTDSFRHIHPDTKDVYSWWTYRFGAKSRNKGWRIDYFFLSEVLNKKLEKAGIHSEQNFSDHAPVFIEMKGLQ